MNEHMKDFIKIVKSLGASDFIIKVVNQIIKNKTKKTKGFEEWISWLVIRYFKY